MLSFKITWTPTKDHIISVRTPRLVDEAAAVFICAENGDLEGLRRLFAAGLGSPFDVHGISGETALHVNSASNLDIKHVE